MNFYVSKQVVVALKYLSMVQWILFLLLLLLNSNQRKLFDIILDILLCSLLNTRRLVIFIVYFHFAHHPNSTYNQNISELSLCHIRQPSPAPNTHTHKIWGTCLKNCQFLSQIYHLLPITNCLHSSQFTCRIL